MSKNYSVMEAGALGNLIEKGRIMLGETLKLTGCEISLNSLPAGVGSPFLHTHKQNEEVHIILGGSGQFKVDDDVFPVQEGSAVRVATGGVRAIKAGGDGIIYMCIQAKQGSLEQATMDDGVIVEGDVTWP